MPTLARRPTARLAFVLVAAAVVSTTSHVGAQQAPLDRLPASGLDVRPPSVRATGEPGRMSVRTLPCRSLPAADVRRRIVDIAIQEWGFFGFIVLDQTEADEDEFEQRRTRRGRGWGRADAPRVASSNAGYWSVTPQWGGIVARQNRAWNGPAGPSARWEAPWSAAFISWVMCEAGLGEARQFQRAIAHHSYIDQAIRAQGAAASRAAYVAHEPGQIPVAPGDLLCTARRPEYRTLAERRRQMGEGARTHCDVVVKVDQDGGRFLTIGGNVRGSVSLKILPAVAMAKGLRPVRAEEIQGGRAVFAHLSLRSGPVEMDTFDRSPTLRALGCASGPAFAARRTVGPLLTTDRLACAD